MLEIMFYKTVFQIQFFCEKYTIGKQQSLINALKSVVLMGKILSTSIAKLEVEIFFILSNSAPVRALKMLLLNKRGGCCNRV